MSNKAARNTGIDSEVFNAHIKEAMTMKKILGFVSVVGLSLVFGLGFAEAKDATLDPDSMINYLDPSNAPARVAPKATGEATGSAVGGMRENPDSLINSLDPSNAPSAARPKGIVVAAAPANLDSIIHFISPAGK